MAACGAPNRRNGLPCQRPTSPGMTRCNLHGGHNPAAKIKSEQMLAQARLPACEALFEIIDQWQEATCPSCGFPAKGDVDTHKVIIRAAQVILDRTGMGPRSTIETVPQKDGDLDLELLTEKEMAQLDYLLGELKTLKGQIRTRLSALPGMPDVPPADATVTH